MFHVEQLKVQPGGDDLEELVTNSIPFQFEARRIFHFMPQDQPHSSRNCRSKG